MNFIYLSPHFPPNYYLFCVHLNQLGVNVLGIADEYFNQLREELRNALKEYYRVGNMENYDELLRALGYFTYRFGKIDRLDSLNEYWLEAEARLRTDFNIFGLKADDMPRIKRKSVMKQVFMNANVPVARGRVVQTLTDAKKLIKETGYPVVAKPDIGVGAAKTYKIHNQDELDNFFATKPDVDYIMEEFIQGDICTFDGLTDREGNIVFFTSHKFSQGIMETVNKDGLVYYYSLRDIPEDLEDTGRRIVKAFAVRERFFHFEFFRLPEGKLVALEVNMRPPGGMTTDMFNYANEIDIYREWANIIVHNRFTADYSRPFHCCYVGRKWNRTYTHTHEEIVQAFGECCLVNNEPISGIFSPALGNHGYLVRSPELDEIIYMANFIQQTSD